MTETELKLIHSKNLPTLQEITSIIDDARFAPSGDNAQPWSFKWNGKSLFIFHSSTIAHHSLNRRNHASMIAFGALLEALRLAATKHAFLTEVRLSIQTSPNDAPWAEICFRPTALITNPLASMIKKRATDRRVYRGGELESRVQHKIFEAISEFRDCKAFIQDKQADRFVKYFLKCEKLLWTDSKIVSDLTKWLRLSRLEHEKSTDGMSSKNIGINLLEERLFRMVRKFSKLPRFIWQFGFGFRIQSDAKKAIQSSSALICFTAKTLDPESLCQLGQMAYRTWLLLNAEGYGVQPLSFASTSIADLISGAVSAGASVESRKVFLEGKSILQENFNLPPNEIPVWMFRTGISSELPEDQRTKRHPVQKLLRHALNFGKL